MAWQCTTPSAEMLHSYELHVQATKMSMAPTLQDEDRQGQLKGEVDSSIALNDAIELPLEDDLGGDGVEKGEHGILPSPMEAHGDEKIEPTPICLIDELVPIPCEHESHLAHLSVSESELSDSHPICEIECLQLEEMSETPSELREVVDRSMEAIAFANTLTSPSFVFPHVPLGSMDVGAPMMDKKMYMVQTDHITPCLYDDDDANHVEHTTTTIPTSTESDYQGKTKGIDESMIPLVDMKNDELFPLAYNMRTTCSFTCVVDNDDIGFRMLCPTCLQYSIILASKIVTNCSFLCLLCKNAYFIVHEMAPIAFSIFDDSKLPHTTNATSCHMHARHAFHKTLIDTNGDVHKTWHIMMDDVFIYHAHTLFVWPIVCIGTRTTFSTSTEHELTKRALESYLNKDFNKKIAHRFDIIPGAPLPKALHALGLLPPLHGRTVMDFNKDARTTTNIHKDTRATIHELVLHEATRINTYIFDNKTSKYLVSMTFTISILSPHHGAEEEQESRTTLPQGGEMMQPRPRTTLHHGQLIPQVSQCLEPKCKLHKIR